MSPKILLLGCGYTLSRLAARLKPHQVVVTTSTPSKLKEFADKGLEACLVNLHESAALEGLFHKYPDLEIVIDSVPPLKDDFTLSARTVTQVIAHSKVRRVIYLSTTGVFGVNDGSWVDESTVCNPRQNKALARRQSEEVYLSRTDSVILRLPAIYGPGRGIGNALREGRYHLVEDGARWSNRIHVDDLVSILQKLAAPEYAHAMPQVLCVSDDCPVQSRDVVEFYCTQFNLPRPKSLSIEEAEKRNLHSMLSNQRVSNKLMKEKLKMTLEYPSYMEGAGTEFE